jgi:hypothetical protein
MNDATHLYRQLYFAYSSDNGNTWSTPVEVTSGKWDDEPVIMQLDPASTASEIALIFNRADSFKRDGITFIFYIYRCRLSLAGAIVNTLAMVTNSASSQKGLCLFRTANKFYITALFQTTPYLYSNTVTGDADLGFEANT